MILGQKSRNQRQTPSKDLFLVFALTLKQISDICIVLEKYDSGKTLLPAPIFFGWYVYGLKLLNKFNALYFSFVCFKCNGKNYCMFQL